MSSIFCERYWTNGYAHLKELYIATAILESDCYENNLKRLRDLVEGESETEVDENEIDEVQPTNSTHATLNSL